MTNRTIAPSEIGMWSTRERDGDVAVVARWGVGEALVGFDEEQIAWTCSECGSFPGARPNASVLTCVHIGAACRDLPYDVAVKIGTSVAQHRKTQPNFVIPGPTDAEIAQARATIAENESRAKQKRAREHDERFIKVTSEVTTRQATDADLERLRLAREAKRKAQGFAWG